MLRKLFASMALLAAQNLAAPLIHQYEESLYAQKGKDDRSWIKHMTEARGSNRFDPGKLELEGTEQSVEDDSRRNKKGKGSKPKEPEPEPEHDWNYCIKKTEMIYNLFRRLQENSSEKKRNRDARQTDWN